MKLFDIYTCAHFTTLKDLCYLVAALGPISAILELSFVRLQALVCATGQVQKWTSELSQHLILQCSLTICHTESPAGP